MGMLKTYFQPCLQVDLSLGLVLISDEENSGLVLFLNLKLSGLGRALVQLVLTRKLCIGTWYLKEQCVQFRGIYC